MFLSFLPLWEKFACCIGAFEDPDIIHVDDAVDPVRDLETISAELRLKVCFLTCCLGFSLWLFYFLTETIMLKKSLHGQTWIIFTYKVVPLLLHWCMNI